MRPVARPVFAIKGPDLVRDVKAAVGKKIPVYLVADDLAERGIPASQTIPGIEHIARNGIAWLIEGHDRILTW